MEKNRFNINNKEIEIGCIELDDEEIYLEDKDRNYFFKVYIKDKWKEICTTKKGVEKEINFSEYCFTEGDLPALVYPKISKVQWLNDEEFLFYFKIDDFSKTVFMSKKDCFNKEMELIEILLVFNVNDFRNGMIKY